MNRTFLATLLLGLILASFLAPALTPPVAEGFPTPAIVSKSWDLEFSYDKPRPIAVKGLDGRMHWFWYLPYKVVNRTGQDRMFVPEFTIATDEGDIIAAGRGVPSAVYDAIAQRMNNPLLESPARIVGKIRQGNDNAKEGVAIWPAFEADITRLTVFVGGLSGETQLVDVPGQDQPTLTSKTLMIDYDLPGRPADPQDQPVTAAGKRWIMR